MSLTRQAVLESERVSAVSIAAVATAAQTLGYDSSKTFFRGTLDVPEGPVSGGVVCVGGWVDRRCEVRVRAPMAARSKPCRPIIHFACSLVSCVGMTVFGMPCDVVFTFWTTAAHGLWTGHRQR